MSFMTITFTPIEYRSCKISQPKRLYKAAAEQHDSRIFKNFVQDVLDNPVYMGKIAYGRRRTERSKAQEEMRCTWLSSQSSLL